jgi:hypothetical protein
VDTADRAAVESTLRRVKRASGQLREAARDLSQLADGLDVVGVTHVHDGTSAGNASELIALGLGRHGAVDVVVIARSGRRNPPRPDHGRRRDP